LELATGTELVRGVRISSAAGRAGRGTFRSTESIALGEISKILFSKIISIKRQLMSLPNQLTNLWIIEGNDLSTAQVFHLLSAAARGSVDSTSKLSPFRELNSNELQTWPDNELLNNLYLDVIAKNVAELETTVQRFLSTKRSKEIISIVRVCIGNDHNGLFK
jgi:hypothetical protein